MFGISFAELAVVFILALLLFGPEKLPEIAKSLGQLFSQLKRSTEELRDEFYRELSTSSAELRNPPEDITHEARRIKYEAVNAEITGSQDEDEPKEPAHD